MPKPSPNPPDKPVDVRSAARQLNIIQAYVQNRKLSGGPLTEKERAELTKLGCPALLDVLLACYEAPYWVSKALTEPTNTPADILQKAKLALDLTTPPPVAKGIRSALVETYYSGPQGDTRRALQASAYECLYEAATEMSGQDLSLPPPPQRAEDPSKGLRALERWALEAMRGPLPPPPQRAEDPSKGLRALERWALEAMRGQQASRPAPQEKRVEPEPKTEEAYLSASELATKYGVPPEKRDALRKRLERLRRRSDDYREVQNPKTHEARFLYRLGAALPLIEDLRAQK